MGRNRGKYPQAGLSKSIPLDERILTIRGQKVILDADLAELYGVPTKALNQAVKRNVARFPHDFVFTLSAEEVDELNRSHTVTGSQKHRDPRFPPHAFTEHGAIMAANVLNSAHAVQMSVFVVRTFVKMRGLLGAHELARKLTTLEQELKSRLDIHEAAIVDILQRIMTLLEPPAPPPESPKPEMGFHVREEPTNYRIRRRPVRS